MPKTRLRWSALVLPGIAFMAMGCGGYTSQYVPPADGRPRLVWEDNKVVATISSPMPAACEAEVGSLAGGDTSVRVARVGDGGGSYSGGGGSVHVWVPVRTVAVVHVHGPGIVPVPHSIGGGGGGGGTLSGLGKLGGGGGGGDIGKAAIVIAVIAIAVLPFIAVGLAAGRPEPEDQVADAIDRVNAQTDLARTPGSACDELVVAGGVAK